MTRPVRDRYTFQCHHYYHNLTNDLFFQEDFDNRLDQEDEQEEQYSAADRTKELYRLSDSSGKMSFTLEKMDKVRKSDFDSKVCVSEHGHVSRRVRVAQRASEGLCVCVCGGGGEGGRGRGLTELAEIQQLLLCVRLLLVYLVKGILSCCSYNRIPAGLVDRSILYSFLVLCLLEC